MLQTSRLKRRRLRLGVVAAAASRDGSADQA